MFMSLNVVMKNKAKEFCIPKDTPNNLKTALKSFLKGETLKVGNYVSTKNALVYRTISTVDGYNQDVICLRIIQGSEVFYLGNSSTLNFEDTKVAFGYRTRRWGESPSQKVMTKIGIPMLPFNTFNQTGLKVMNTKIIDQTGSEVVKRETKRDKKDNPIFEDVHFTGASLFQNESKCFLFDIDREEIKHGIFNPFIVELPKNVETIKDAYESLIPNEVKMALKENKQVLRQGEYFFIKMLSKDALKPDTNGREGYKTARLQAQGNRPHEASLFNEKTGLVSGFVKHWGREHKDLDLSMGWFLAVPNTAARSFTLTGDID